MRGTRWRESDRALPPVDRALVDDLADRDRDAHERRSDDEDDEQTLRLQAEAGRVRAEALIARDGVAEQGQGQRQTDEEGRVSAVGRG